MSRLADNIDQIKQDKGFGTSTHPGSQAILEELDALKANPSPSLNDLNVLNKIAGNVATSGNVRGAHALRALRMAPSSAGPGRRPKGRGQGRAPWRDTPLPSAPGASLRSCFLGAAWQITE